MNNNKIKKTTSYEELSILDAISSVYQLDIVSLRQIFLLLTRNFYANPRAFSPCGTSVPTNFYNYTYSDALVDPNKTVNDTLVIDLDYSSAVNSIDKIDYLKVNNKPAIYISVKDFSFNRLNVLDDITKNLINGTEQAMLGGTKIVFTHYANTYDDAAQLAYLTTAYFTAMKETIRRSLKVLTFIPEVMTSPTPAVEVDDYENKSQKYFKSDVVFDMKFEVNWRVIPEAVLIKKFSLDINHKLVALKA